MARTPSSELGFLTFTSFCNATNRSEIDPLLLKAIALLVNSSHALLETHAMLIDDDATEHEIPAEDWARARETGQLFHPSTGNLVPDFEAKLFPFFVPSQYFHRALR